MSFLNTQRQHAGPVGNDLHTGSDLYFFKGGSGSPGRLDTLCTDKAYLQYRSVPACEPVCQQKWCAGSTEMISTGSEV